MKRINWKQITLKATDKVKAGEVVTVFGTGVHNYGDAVEHDISTRFAVTASFPESAVVGELYQQQLLPEIQKHARRARKQECDLLFLFTFRGEWDLSMFGAIGEACRRDTKALDIIADGVLGLCPDCVLGLHQGEQ